MSAAARDATEKATLLVVDDDDAVRFGFCAMLRRQGFRIIEAESVAAALRVFDSAVLVRWAMPRLAALTHEEVWVLALDGNMHLRAASS